MGGSTGFIAYPPSPDHVWWIRDGKSRRDMTPDELAERHRKDRETYRRMRERMAIDPEYREARLAVARRGTKKWQAKNRSNPAVIERRRQRDRERYAQRRMEIAARSRELYVGERAERMRAKNREWYARNREKRREYSRRYRQANAERLRARENEQGRRDYALDPKRFNDYQKQWRAKNPEKAHLYLRVSSQNRRIAAEGPSFTTNEWLAVVAQYGGRCAYCGEAGPLEIEHRIPLSRGGTNSIDNIVPSCKRCNRRKRAKTDTEFREVLAREAATRAGPSAMAPDPDGSAPAE